MGPIPTPGSTPTRGPTAASGSGLLIAFRGPVRVRAGQGAVTLLLRGYEARPADRHPEECTELAFAAAQSGTLPTLLVDARVFGPDLPRLPDLEASAPGRDHAPMLQRYRIEATLGAAGSALGAAGSAGALWSTELLARSLQVHRDAVQALIAAVPPPRVPLARRFGWLALLWLLRLPIMVRIVERIRGAT